MPEGSTTRVIGLGTGAQARVRGPEGAPAALLLDGGIRRAASGVWGPTPQIVADRLAPELPGLRLIELRYRVRSYRRLDLCTEDARAAVALAGGAPLALVGYSMGGAVAIGIADAPGVVSVTGIAPWVPGHLDLTRLRGRRVLITHGTLDADTVFPGVSRSHSRGAWARMRSLGVEAEYVTIPWATHGLALRAPWGLVPLPRCREWLGVLRGELARLCG